MSGFHDGQALVDSTLLNQKTYTIITTVPLRRRLFASPDFLDIMGKKKTPDDFSSPIFLVLAAVISVPLWVLPFGWVALYPFRIFTTFVHEGGHALASILTNGSVERIVIYADASGETYTRGGIALVVASAGYLASCGFGALLLGLSRRGRNAEKMLFLNSLLTLSLTFLFLTDSLSFILGMTLAAGLFIAGMTRSVLSHLLLNFLAVQCCLNGLFDLLTLLKVTTGRGDLHNDALIMEKITLIPAPAWAIGWALVSLLFLVSGLLAYARNGRG